MLRKSMMAIACLLVASTSAWAADDATATPSAPAAAKPVTAMEEPLQGDFWTFELRDEISGKITAVRTHLVTEVSPSEISIRVTTQGKETEGMIVFDRSWNVKTSGEWKYQPGDGSGIHTPLKVGDSWSFSADDVNNAKGYIWKRSGRSKVVGQETVTTKAGTFETYKIEATYLRRPTNDPTRKNDITTVVWYAPAIDHWVKRSLASRANGHLLLNNTFELVEYGRKN
ncbi:hypothetical protein QA645_02135 [Bradyrhizobium sp. CIAT3101]|uniref:hypothetical protein n=1 Tax=Bradyrhizobium sp. CIAT3101 TaxID=439387 RepID=UPI0024B1BFED|nr:hypothetical protein [Bradyrhizobium sp. CIAT3101]WFU81567.1 hypothetical protein QA645_02135 [Bradyrhizobium sp. CIAT3101]